ncbi:hypothetical protein SDC9_189661 [bioreactor metagenome]|uniref:Uncharacterized protein n=1 Tax=bioreactor metagenome TaxID=1076179 RepID=A0A645HSS7_9ZZZZ
MLKAKEADGFQHFQNLPLDFRLRELHRPLSGGVRRVGNALHPQPEGHVFKHVHVGKQGVFLEHRVNLPLIGRNVINPHTVEQDISRRWFQEAAYDPQRCGFPAAAGPEQCEEFSVVDI